MLFCFHENLRIWNLFEKRKMIPIPNPNIYYYSSHENYLWNLELHRNSTPQFTVTSNALFASRKTWGFGIFLKKEKWCVSSQQIFKHDWLSDWVSGFAEFDSMVYKKASEEHIQNYFLQVKQKQFLKCLTRITSENLFLETSNWLIFTYLKIRQF